MGNYEWDAVVAARANLLIEGDSAETTRLVGELLSNLTGPVIGFPRADPLPDGDVGVLLVADVDRLTVENQQALMSALNRTDRRLQVICTSSTPLYRRVERGDFLPALYYRLNVVRIILPSPGPTLQ